MTNAVALWSSRDRKFTATLVRGYDAWRFAEQKNGGEIAAFHAPFERLKTEEAAIAHFEKHIRSTFDVSMRRTNPGVSALRWYLSRLLGKV